MFSANGTPWLRGAIALTVLAGVSCKENEPPPRHFQDLGVDRRVLLPTSSVWSDATIAQGRADWHPFDPPAEGEAPVAAVDNSALETAIRASVTEYNELIQEAEPDDLLEYFVAGQQDALRPLLEITISLTKSLAVVRGDLKSKLPDDGARIDAALDILESGLVARLPVESITIVSPTEATATLGAGSLASTCTFRLIDEDWFFEIPSVERLAALAPALDAARTKYANWEAGLTSGDLPPETGLEQLEAAAQLAAALVQAVKAKPSEADPNPTTDGDAGDPEVITEIRELIDEYNDLIGDATAEEFLEYYPEAQHAAMQPLFELGASMAEQFASLRTELTAKLADQGDRIDKAVAALEAEHGLKIVIDSVRVVSETEVQCRLSGSALRPTGTIRMIDDDWYLQFPTVANFSRQKPALEAALAQYTAWTAGLDSGQMTPETVLGEIEKAGQTVGGLRKALGLDGA